jgi:hypothetical protein
VGKPLSEPLEASRPPTAELSEGDVEQSYSESDHRMDVEHQLHINSDWIRNEYATYVFNLCECLKGKNITVEQLRTWVLLRNLPGINDRLKEAHTLNSIFDMISECASFFNYYIYQAIQDKFCSDSDYPQLNYSEHFKAFINLSKISEFFDLNPKLKVMHGNSKKLVLKVDNIQISGKVVEIVNIQHGMARILGVKPSALRLVNAEGGCVLLTFLVPEAVAEAALAPSEHQKREYQRLSIQSLTCGDQELKPFYEESSGEYTDHDCCKDLAVL